MSDFTEHPLRKELSEEVHARPYGLLKAPVRVAHLAVLSGEGGVDDDNKHIALLCKAFNVPEPASDARHYSGVLNSSDECELRMKWERHTEFSSYTFYCSGDFDDPFAASVVDMLPADWLAKMPGEVLSATNLSLEGAETSEREFTDLADLFANNLVTGSAMRGGQALVWTDFRVHEDGFNRILVRDQGMNQRQGGRLIQRLLEVSAYRMMAMLAFPLARDVLPRVSQAEATLNELMDGMASSDGGEDERRVLKKLTALAADIESLSLKSNYRFSAANAYHALVKRRIEELREIRLDDVNEVRGLQPPGEFVTRRLAPAMETCRSAADRLEALAKRIGRASDLLRTRVDVALEEQNRDLLESMDRRAKVQLRLQETVEGLSVVAISYYLLGLISYTAKSVKAAGVPINADITTGLSLPIVIGIIWFGLRRLRRALSGSEDG
ncbi:MAG: DUF3422 domain-containing protein [Rhodospirillaceae bacterium]|jgi:uncharacterized membrane-anchored protein|nr:DUF3422 domain-containing protein [Rhodospirillaceae bacterium]MBT4463427.1 DUF3422 domain-containing protein [Rhodospirillaceae bacterium]MBT5012897.1 DUF3422 domain-containing protein [Rhodospirillaceae bacterium]MBT5308251.1 DUF3422 domain-containing protein [Rhodospirillaceae bacterium]MBT6407425.1 DUF3422 domain-containing protein [Rhodospirillaceae bacterium]